MRGNGHSIESSSWVGHLLAGGVSVPLNLGGGGPANGGVPLWASHSRTGQPVSLAQLDLEWLRLCRERKKSLFLVLYSPGRIFLPLVCNCLH